MPMSNHQLNRTMNGLRPGDVLTNLSCGGCQSKKILVLAHAGDNRYDFSVRADEINIIRDTEGPWRWNEHELVFRNKAGEAHDHIGAEVEVLEAAGLRELQWYRELPSPALVRFRIDPHQALGPFLDAGTVAKLEAIINRSDGHEGFARDLQQAIDLVFFGATDAVDERRMRYLVTLIYTVGEKLGRSRSRGPDIRDILGAAIFSGIGGMPDLPGELGAMFGGLHSRDVGEGRSSERRNRSRGNGHDRSDGGMPG